MKSRCRLPRLTGRLESVGVGDEGHDEPPAVHLALRHGWDHAPTADGPTEKQHPRLYDTFGANWYKGYAAGFLATLVLGGAAWKSAKGAIEGTDSFQAVSSVVADTRTFRVLRQVQYAKNRLKARTTARLLLQFDDAPSGLLRQADTAGEAFHVWRVSRTGRRRGGTPRREPTITDRDCWQQQATEPSVESRNLPCRVLYPSHSALADNENATGR